MAKYVFIHHIQQREGHSFLQRRHQPLQLGAIHLGEDRNGCAPANSYSICLIMSKILPGKERPNLCDITRAKKEGHNNQENRDQAEIYMI